MLWSRMSFHVIFWRSTVLRVLATSPSSPCLRPAGRRASGHLKSPNRFGCSQNLWQRGKDMMLKNWMHLSDQELVTHRPHLNHCWPTPLLKGGNFGSVPTSEIIVCQDPYHGRIPLNHFTNPVSIHQAGNSAICIHHLESVQFIWDEVLWSRYDRTRLILIHNIHTPMPSSVDNQTIHL